MKKAFKVLGVIIIIMAGLVLGLNVFIQSTYPKVSEAPELTINPTPEMLARGEYLANTVMSCTECHAERDWSKLFGPVKPDSRGMGGDFFGHDLGFPGEFYSRNITPAGIGDWTDGEIFRLLTTGVDKDGEPIFPVMPFESYNEALDAEDAKSVIAYIRTLEAKSSIIPESKPDFPMNLIMRTIPKDYEPKTKPDTSDKIAYGKYMVTIAACGDCHTPREKGELIMELFMAGGAEFKLPTGGTVRAANITPHIEKGIGSWSEEEFVDKFKHFRNPEVFTKAKPNEFNSIMPWATLAHIKDSDLRAMYQYLQSIPPIRHSVTKFTPDS